MRIGTFGHRAFVGASALTLAFSIGAAALAMKPLNQEKHINDSLISAGIGELIRRNCSSISPRYFVFYRKSKELERYALNLGYSKTEIRAFLDNKAEQDRVRKAAKDYLAANGVVKGDEATYCALGLAEIENGSLTGQLLRAH